MEWKNFKSNSIEGYNFIMGMMSIEERWKVARKLFTSFIEANGFTAWHIHDGWVSHKYQNGSVLHNPEINITWITEHAGYSHVYRCPEIGERMIIVGDSPDTDKLKPFDIYCYDVVAKPQSFGYQKIELKLIEVKQVIFNKEENIYQFYIKERWDIFSFLKRKVKSKDKSSACR